VTDVLAERLEPLRNLPDRLAERSNLDRLARPVREAVSRRVAPGSELNTALAGTWLGHPLHPLLTDVVIGAWSAAAVVDLVGGRSGHPHARRLVGLGLIAGLPTAASGLNDWSTLVEGPARIGAVHGATNAAGTVLMAASWWARLRHHWMRGRVLSLAGLGLVALGGFLGGDLTYRRAIGVDQTATLSGEGDWTAVADESDLTEGSPALVKVGDMDVVLVRAGGVVRALADRCAHQGGPLHEGKVDAGCVTCPWHSSRFRLSDGAALSGPTAHPQPVLQVRTVDGKIEVRRR